MDQFTVKILQSEGVREVAARSGDNLHRLLLADGRHIDASCGGRGTCGKCRVRAGGGLSAPTEQERKLLEEEAVASGLRLACLCTVTGDATVELFDGGEMLVQTAGELRRFTLSPHVSVRTLHVPRGTLEKQTDDASSLLEALAASGVRASSICPAALRSLPETLRGQDYHVDAVTAGDRVLRVTGAGQARAAGMAVDIGTTTVVAYFYNLIGGGQLGVLSGLNRQSPFGADVISRISHCIDNEGGKETLQKQIASQLREMISRFCRETGYAPAELMDCVVAGNAVMERRFAGVTPNAIANAPFIAGTLFGCELPARELGLPLHPDAGVFLTHSIASYVGGDITAAVLACGMANRKGPQLLIDIGTNGEMVLGDRNGMVACSTAAGPAFEGASIRCGVGGVPGAINRVSVENGELRLTTIGDKPPIGICGSGLIDAVAAMLKLGVMDETGRILDEDEVEDEAASRRLIELDDSPAFLLHEESGIAVTQKDVREVQLGKAAIAAGINTLLHKAGLELSEIKRLYVAGGFGAHIDKESAALIGLLPESVRDRTETIGNAAGSGAILALLSSPMRARLGGIQRKTGYIELSGDPFFQDEYVDRMMFESF